MRKKQIAICDSEEAYTRRFAEFANRNMDTLFAVHGYTDCQGLLDSLAGRTPDLLLLAEEYAGQLCGAVMDFPVILLTDQDYLEEGSGNCPAISKYQSCPRLMRQAMTLYAEIVPLSLGAAVHTGHLRRLAVYSPIGRCGKTTLALALGWELSKSMRTLYLNLEEYSGFAVLHPGEGDSALSELMYFLRQGKKAFACRLEGMLQHMGSLDYLPPMRSLAELREVSREDWEELLDALERESRYEAVILDLGSAADGLFTILDRCDWIYMPTAEDETACAKLRQYEDTLGLLELSSLEERTSRVVFRDPGEAERFAEQEKARWSNQ